MSVVPTRLRWILPILMLSLSVAAAADATRIELIELKGRTAEELIPLLQPLVEPEGALSGSGYRLIVRATPAQQQEIRRLLEELDRAPRRLLITVHMGELGYRERQAAELAIDQPQGDATVRLGTSGKPDARGLNISQTDPAVSASARLHSTRTYSAATDRQQVQTLEGQPAFIATGSDHPYPTHLETWQGPRGGSGGAVGIDYKQTATGFYAVARIRDGQVHVQVSPQKEKLRSDHSGTVDSQQLSTVASGPLGSWLLLGGSGTRGYRDSSHPGGTVTTRELKQQPIWLKVNLLP
jgi:hypothetical protein